MPPLSNGLQTILFIAIDADDRARVQLDQEVQGIAEGLQRSQRSGQFRLEQRLVTSPREIQRAMLDVEPQILHFVGAAGNQGLVFADQSGNAQPITGTALAGLFALFADQVQCVVLNGCYAQLQAQAMAEQVPAVIGMSAAIGNEAAMEFAVSFYDALGAGRPLEFAYKLGRSALQLSGIAEHLLPVLLQSAVESVTEATPTPPPAPAPPGNSFNISGSTITNLTGSGAIHYQEAAKVEPGQDTQFSFSTPEPAAPTMPMAAAKPASEKQSTPQNIELFFSYAHRDEELRDEMAKHLSLLKRQGVITDWHDRDIGAGTEWAQEIDDHLNSAQVILLLISPDFMASDYCFDIEMNRAMERHVAGEACVIPVILRPVDWSGAPFGKLQALPIVRGGGAKPITSWTNRDEAFFNVAQGIRKAVDRLAAR